MKSSNSLPGISRNKRISDEGLKRLQAQLQRGQRLSNSVLTQWINRYGDQARELINAYGYRLDKQQEE